MLDDFELLREHAERGSDEAFRTLVERHAAMVHGTALRMVRDAALAEEITQAVFIILARKAASLQAGTILAGWLHRMTRFVALEALRSEHRRQQHHRQFAAMNDATESASVWDQIAPLLDEAMTRLSASDRDAVVLRFLQGCSFAEVASALGTSEAAAKMRVGRALEKLRRALGCHGAVVSVTALTTALSTHAVSAMPAGLAATVAGTSLASTSTINSTLAPLASGAIKLMVYNKLKISFAAAATVLLILGGAVVTLYQRPGAPARFLVVTTFEPMAGEWEGSYESRGDGIPATVRQKVALSVRTTGQGRSCEIEMRVLDDADRTNAVFHFTHTLNRRGDRIITADDPRIRRIGGDGLVTEAAHDQTTGDWRAAFHAARPNSADFTECRWVRQGDELIINRQDVSANQQGSTRLFSNLILRRRGA